MRYALYSLFCVVILAACGCASSYDIFTQVIDDRVAAFKELFPDIVDDYIKEGSDALRIEDYKTAEDRYLDILNEYENRGIDFVVGYPYKYLSKIYFAQGKYCKSLACREVYINNRQDNHNLPAYYEECRTGDIFLAQGKFKDAFECYQRALNSINIEKENDSSNLEIIQVYHYLGMYYIQQDDYVGAIDVFQRALQHYLEKHMARADHEGRAELQLAMAHLYSGDDAEAEKLLKEALSLNINSFVVWEDYLSLNLILLGRLYERRGKYDNAEKYYQHSIKISSGRFAIVYRTQKANSLNIYGGYLVRQGRYDDAEKAFDEAVELRQATTTATHPGYADSLKGLADVAVAQDEFTSATTLASQALDVLDTALVPTHPRIAPTLVALASLNLLTGQADQAELAFQRLDAVLQGPLGMYREDIQDTLAFYRKVLQQKGNESGAMRLEEMAKKAELRKDKEQTL